MAQDPGEPGRQGPRRTRIDKDQGRVEARRARVHPAAGPVSRAVRQRVPQGAHQLLSAARGQQGGLGQHRHFRMARLSDADQGRLPVPRLHPRRADRARPGPVLRPGAAGAPVGDPGVAVVLLQEPPDGPGALPRARPVYPTDQAQEHAAVADGRGTNHPPRYRVLREGVSVAQYVVTAVGLAAIVWVLWYFLLSRGSATGSRSVAGLTEVLLVVKGGYTPDTVVVRAGDPVRLQVYRDQAADCSDPVVFEDFGIDAALPAFQTTPVEFTPEEAGEFRFRCGMNMLKGLLVVEPAGADRRPSTSPHASHE